MSCATTGCSDPTCPVCSVPRRFATTGQSALAAEPLRANAPALNGQKPARTERDPRFTKRQRKALEPGTRRFS
jgi:hypothetical protein